MREQRDIESGPRCEMGVRTLLSFGVICFLGSGGRAIMQHVVPCVYKPNPLRCGNGCTQKKDKD